MRILTSTQAAFSSSRVNFHFARFVSSALPAKSSLLYFSHIFSTPQLRAAKIVKFSQGKLNRSIRAMAKAEDARKPPALPLPPVSSTKFKIALCQLSVTEDKERNIAHARVAIEAAADKGAQLVVLPFAVAVLQTFPFFSPVPPHSLLGGSSLIPRGGEGLHPSTGPFRTKGCAGVASTVAPLRAGGKGSRDGSRVLRSS
ncbi:omega-amidase, chloroplastic [Cryptomeria japonica]|uniref:omega-amidase, chloroplastic n=1 Tax=Cryptomeria japonica TaxID=3369 RepID=UPI0027DAA0BC|nr:omega-amidase, chloroplastic [Cryptomeria japonica]